MSRAGESGPTLDLIQGLLREASQELDMVESGDHERALTLLRQAVSRLNVHLSDNRERDVYDDPCDCPAPGKAGYNCDCRNPDVPTANDVHLQKKENSHV